MKKKGWLISGIFLFSLTLVSQEIKILTNHIGYELNESKKAVILAHNKTEINKFTIRNFPANTDIFSGIARYVGPVAKWKDWHFWTIEFDPVHQMGQFYIEIKVDDRTYQSFPFYIEDNILEHHCLSNVIYYFKSQRCSGPMDKADTHIPFSGDNSKIVDAHGGWYDATGDYGKHLSHLSFSTYFNPQQISLTVWSLFKTSERLDKRNDTNFTQYRRRLLDEAMYGADYLVRIKKAGGSFYRSISAPGPGKKPEDRRIAADMTGFKIKEKPPQESDLSKTPENTPDHNFTYEVGFRAGGGLSIAALAMASTYPSGGDFYPSDYLKAAEEAFSYLDQHNIDLTNDGRENIIDDYCALGAATELFKATKKNPYHQAATRRAQNLINRLTNWQKYQNFWSSDSKNRPFFHPSDAGLPVISLIGYLEIADESMQTKVLETIKKSLAFELAVSREVSNPFLYARQLIQNSQGEKKTAFFFPHDSEAAPWWQGENARLASLATAARLAAPYFKEDRPFYQDLQAYAWAQLNWILGLNPFDTCMLHGSGRNNPWYMFFHSYEYTNCPGGICNGITAGFTDADDIDFNLTYDQTGKDHDWRWGEQWLPHAAWFLMAISSH